MSNGHKEKCSCVICTGEITSMPLSLAKATDLLAPITQKIGVFCGVGLSVDCQGADLAFVDDRGDAVMDPSTNQVVVCATADQLVDDSWIRYFSERAFTAALILRMAEHA